MHTNEWPARRVIEQCEPSEHCKCMLTGYQRCPSPQACELPEQPKSKREACSPAVGVLIGATLGALMICGAVWLWRSLL